MRDYRDAKAMAHSLREALTHKAIAMSHGECLELIAKSFGVDTWNILSAKIEAAQPASRPVAADTAKGPHFCSFCGKAQQDVRILIAGPQVCVCDECVALCDEIVDDYHINGLLKREPEKARKDLESRSTLQLRAFIAACRSNLARSENWRCQIEDHLAARDAGTATSAPPMGTKTTDELNAMLADGQANSATTERALALAQEILAARTN